MEGAMFASNSTENSWSMLPIWLLAAMMIMMYYWRFWEPWANAMSAILLPNFGLKIMTGTTVFGCLAGAHPYWTKKTSKSTILQNRLNKEKLLVDVANLATCCHDDYDVLLEVLGTLGKCYVSSPVAKTLEIMTGTTVFGCLAGAHPYWTKKASKPTILHNGLNKEKTPGRCCQSGYMLP